VKQGLTEIVLVLDRSGSMAATKDDAEGGLRTFVEKQKQVEGKAVLTFYRFDDAVERVFEATDIQLVEPGQLKLEPRNMTALLDAMGRAIDEVGDRLKKMHEDERPEKVIFVTVTDGMENASRIYAREGIFNRIAKQRDIYKWDFVFIGANQDAIATASSLGIGQKAAMTQAATAQGTEATYASLSSNVAHVRTSGGPYAWSQQDREDALKGN